MPWKISFHGFQIKRSEFKLSNCRKTPILYLLNGERERERERERGGVLLLDLKVRQVNTSYR